MTKIVKNYVADKIRKAAEPKLAALKKAARDAAELMPCHDDVMKAVYASDEYKALEGFIRKWAKDRDANVVCTGYRTKRLMREEFKLEYRDVLKANKALNDFSDKVDEVVRDTLVTMELSKSKADVDELIGQALQILL